MSALYAGTVLVPLLILAGLAVYGFRTALAGRPVALKLEESEPAGSAPRSYRWKA